MSSKSLRSVVPFLFVVVTTTMAACVGDDPILAGTSPGSADAGTGTDGATPETDAGGGDVTVGCPAGFADCDGDPSTQICSVDLRTSPEHCGACGRSCGTAACSAGECAIVKLRDGLDHPWGLAQAGARLIWYEGTDKIRGCRADDCSVSTAILVDIPTATTAPPVKGYPRQFVVDGNKFYFSGCPGTANTDCRLAACDVTGCKATGATFVTAANGYRRSLFVAQGLGATAYTWFPLDGMFRTDLPSGPATGVTALYKPIDYVQAVHADATRFVYVDDDPSTVNPNGGIFVCPIAGCTGARTMLLPPPVKYLAFANDTVFTTTGGANASAASIQACSAAGCGGAGTVLATNQAYVSDMVADDSALYWATVGAPDLFTNTAAVGTIMKCALPACAGGPQKIAENVLNPISLQIDGTDVTWLTRGTASAQDGAIFRRRR